MLGTQVVREELEYIPAKLRIVRYTQAVYECPKCKHSDYPYIVKAETPTSLMNHSLASPSSVANVMYQKYVNSSKRSIVRTSLKPAVLWSGI